MMGIVCEYHHRSNEGQVIKRHIARASSMTIYHGLREAQDLVEKNSNA